MRRMAFLVAALSLAVPAVAQQSNNGMIGVKIAVKDFQKTIAFYTALGMKTGPKHNATEWQLDWANPGSGSNIIMVLDANGTSRLKPGGAFMMIQVPDAKATADKLRAAGFPGIGEPRVMPQASMLIIQDPDGNQIEMLSAPAAR